MDGALVCWIGNICHALRIAMRPCRNQIRRTKKERLPRRRGDAPTRTERPGAGRCPNLSDESFKHSACHLRHEISDRMRRIVVHSIFPVRNGRRVRKILFRRLVQRHSPQSCCVHLPHSGDYSCSKIRQLMINEDFLAQSMSHARRHGDCAGAPVRTLHVDQVLINEIHRSNCGGSSDNSGHEETHSPTMRRARRRIKLTQSFWAQKSTGDRQ
jgi:hypothetical protein